MSAFDTAIDVLNEGLVGEDALAEWIVRIRARGERFCPLAQELLMSSVSLAPVRVDEEVSDTQVVANQDELKLFNELQQEGVVPSSADVVFEPQFGGEFSVPDVPGEPVVEFVEPGIGEG